jgi:hypothetical protein
MPRWLGVAAAVLVVGMLGLVVALASGRRDGDDSGGDVAQDAAETADQSEDVADLRIESAAEEPAADEPASEASPLSTGGAEALADATVPVEMDAADAPTIAAEEPASEPAEEPAAEEGATGSRIDPQAHLDGEPITTPEQLGAVGRHLLDLIEQRQLPPTPEHSCPIGDVLADGTYVADAPIEIYIAVDTEAQQVLAIATETCVVVVETPLP